jgi:hypothetical protein
VGYVGVGEHKIRLCYLRTSLIAFAKSFFSFSPP